MISGILYITIPVEKEDKEKSYESKWKVLWYYDVYMFVWNVQILIKNASHWIRNAPNSRTENLLFHDYYNSISRLLLFP